MLTAAHYAIQVVCAKYVGWLAVETTNKQRPKRQRVHVGFYNMVDLMGVVLLWLHNVWMRRDTFHLLFFFF